MISVIIDGGGKCHAVWHGGKLNDMLLAILREADVINIKPAIDKRFEKASRERQEIDYGV